MHAYILLDRSGSMQGLWVEALSSVNAYVKELSDKTAKDAVDSYVSLAVFDGHVGGRTRPMSAGRRLRVVRWWGDE